MEEGGVFFKVLILNITTKKKKKTLWRNHLQHFPGANSLQRDGGEGHRARPSLCQSQTRTPAPQTLPLHQKNPNIWAGRAAKLRMLTEECFIYFFLLQGWMQANALNSNHMVK